jgi:hypothetical protein
MKRIAVCSILIGAGLVSHNGLAAPEQAPGGIAAGFPRDSGIGKDSRVVFAEDFENGTVEELAKRWTSIKSLEGGVVVLHADSPASGRGRRCAQVTATQGKDDGGYLYKRLDREFDKLHVRFYVKFPAEPGYIHHFVHIGGYHPGTDWPQGGAGERPRGDDRITVGIEPYGAGGRFEPPGAWNFYSYWGDMKVSTGGKFWGNAMAPESPLVVPRDRWQCVEVMIKLNSIKDGEPQHDGELALWLDGAESMRIKAGTRRGLWSGMGFSLPREGGEPFEGFRFRTSPALKLNFVWMLHYVTGTNTERNKDTDPPRENRVWFDNIVAATEYIGPIAADR